MRKVGEKLFMLVFIIAVVGAIGIALNEFEAEDFCKEKGHDTGRYKGYDGGVYSCVDFTSYDAKTKLLKEEKTDASK